MSDEIPMELSLQMGRYVLLSTLWVKSTHFHEGPSNRGRERFVDFWRELITCSI